MNYKHIKTGNEYELMFVANRQSTKPNFPEMAVYRNLKDGVIYARPWAEFKEKFVRV